MLTIEGLYDENWNDADELLKQFILSPSQAWQDRGYLKSARHWNVIWVVSAWADDILKWPFFIPRVGKYQKIIKSHWLSTITCKFNIKYRHDYTEFA